MVDNSSMNKADEILSRAIEAAAVFHQYNQEETDRIVRAVFEAALSNRVRLAKLANEETGIGRWEDKVLKNVVGSLIVYNDIKDQKTVGIISDNKHTGIMEMAHPIGPILAIIPITNPTSTVIFKILIALKSRNPIIINPPQKAIKSCVETAKLCYEAALKADAPENCIQWTREPGFQSESGNSHAETQALMSNPKLALILATGGSSIVKAAYSSGTPALGVGAGNVPVFIDKSADISFAIKNIFLSKTFDNGTICASEQAVVVEEAIADKVISEFKSNGAYFLTEEQIKKVEEVAWDKKKNNMSAAIVGQSVEKIASMAGITVPEGTKLLMAHLKGVGEEYPLSSEILCPLLAFYVEKDFDSALGTCIDLNFNGGMGHSASIYANDDAVIKRFASEMNAGRIVVNSPSSQGGVGGIYNKLHTSLTLGCGTSGKNITTDNVTAKHLINIQRIARRVVNERFFNIERHNFFDEKIDALKLEKIFNSNY